MAIGFESPEQGPFDQQTYGFAHGNLTERRNVTIWGRNIIYRTEYKWYRMGPAFDSVQLRYGCG